MIDKESILQAFKLDILLKKHAYKRIKDRGISIFDIEEAIKSDDIIEQYPDDFPLSSILLLGFYQNNPLHIVCAPTEKNLIVITAYIPNLLDWDDNWSKRKSSVEGAKK